ncbi:hypothetical protein C8Q78DRAFT_585691 [Trametes maxima]|nr:hypothetical protein C8Q78DRAFT_585691 [Trametes maxima]
MPPLVMIHAFDFPLRAKCMGLACHCHDDLCSCLPDGLINTHRYVPETEPSASQNDASAGQSFTSIIQYKKQCNSPQHRPSFPHQHWRAPVITRQPGYALFLSAKTPWTSSEVAPLRYSRGLLRYVGHVTVSILPQRASSQSRKLFPTCPGADELRVDHPRISVTSIRSASRTSNVRRRFFAAVPRVRWHKRMQSPRARMQPRFRRRRQ